MPERPTIDKLFYQHLIAEDELGVVVRAHIHLEASLNEFVETLIPYPERLPRLLFEARLRLACALGLRDDYFEALKFFGDLRNRFAHKLDAKLDDATLNDLHSKLPADGRELTLQAYERTNEQRGETSRPDFKALAAKDRFVLIAVVLKGFIVAATHEAKSVSQRT